MFGQVGPWQLVIIVALVLLIFGAKRLPDTARALGKSMRILKSEAAAMKKDSSSGQAGPADPAAGTAGDQPAPRTIQAAPGDVASARPVEEPNRSARD